MHDDRMHCQRLCGANTCGSGQDMCRALLFCSRSMRASEAHSRWHLRRSTVEQALKCVLCQIWHADDTDRKPASCAPRTARCVCPVCICQRDIRKG